MHRLFIRSGKRNSSRSVIGIIQSYTDFRLSATYTWSLIIFSKLIFLLHLMTTILETLTFLIY